jgi:hypothetical protein
MSSCLSNFVSLSLPIINRKSQTRSKHYQSFLSVSVPILARLLQSVKRLNFNFCFSEGNCRKIIKEKILLLNLISVIFLFESASVIPVKISGCLLACYTMIVAVHSYLITCLLCFFAPHSTTLVEKLPVLQPVKKFPKILWKP